MYDPIGETLTTDPEWLFIEDAALKAQLTGLTVADGKNPARTVGVWFGVPDQEIRTQSYPYLSINLIDIQENSAQVQSTYLPLDDPNSSYLAAQLPTWDDTASAQAGEYYLSPMLLTYQVASYARNPRHDREILSQLQHGPLHPRFAQVTCSDNTVRRVIVRSFAKRDTYTADATGVSKRLFRNIWTIQIPSEMFYEPLTLTQRVQQTIINVDAVITTTDGEVLTPPAS